MVAADARRKRSEVPLVAVSARRKRSAVPAEAREGRHVDARMPHVKIAAIRAHFYQLALCMLTLRVYTYRGKHRSPGNYTQKHSHTLLLQGCRR